jgi:2-methylisocitrate lyase-like PEP mutase family enzyme
MTDLNRDDRQRALGEAFCRLHQPGNPIALFNVWDALSARTVADAGAKAIATASWSVAAAHGFEDGEKMPWELALANLGRVVRATPLPTSFDMERGYSEGPEGLADNVHAVISAGAVGANLEDSIIEGGALRPAPEQVRRIAAARAAADASGIRFFINARIDVLLAVAPGDRTVGHVEACLERARAYADAGADGIFIPGLTDERLIALAARDCPLPLNVSMRPNSPGLRQLAELGVARVSHGPMPCRAMIESLGREAARTFAGR